MDWFNYYGLIFVAVILIPNLFYAAKSKGVSLSYRNRTAEIIEQIGRYASMTFMIFNVPYTYFGFWFPQAQIVYWALCGALILAYCIGWVVFWNKNNLTKALTLSVLPSLIFLASAILLAQFPLLIAALLFAPAHILISCKSAANSRNADVRACSRTEGRGGI